MPTRPSFVNACLKQPGPAPKEELPDDEELPSDEEADRLVEQLMDEQRLEEKQGRDEGEMGEEEDTPPPIDNK